MKRLIALILTIGLFFSLSACERSETVTMYDVDLGQMAHHGATVMGVTYDLYDQGYALIASILHEHAQLEETVFYEGKEYTVFGFVQPKVSTGNDTGVFGFGENASPADLVLPNSIRGISNFALAYCSANTITLPAKLQALGGGVFANCTNLETLDIPDSVTYIGANKLFQNCTRLKSVSFPADCEVRFFQNTFERCTNLEAATVPASVDEIGMLAFYHCEALTSVTIENGVQRIKGDAFINCPQLKQLVIPDSVTFIEDYAFQGCTGLTDITLSDHMSDVSAHLFTDINKQDADVSCLTIRVKPDLVSYVQSIYPEANVVAK